MCNFVTGGVWDKPRLQEAGYVVDDHGCELCGERDSLEHRLWTCAGTESLRNKYLTDKQLQWLKEKADDDDERENTRKKTRHQGPV